jgi:replicative DNA helicase
MAQPLSAVPNDPEIEALRLPPHSIEAEQSVLGALLIDNGAFDRIADMVGEADFYRDDHRRIFQHLVKLITSGKAADMLTVAESLEQSADAGQTGGKAYLMSLANNTPLAANIRRYAEIVRERAIMRKLVGAGNDIAASALNPLGRDAKELLDAAESLVFRIAEEGSRTTQGFIQAKELVARAIDRISDLHERGSPDVTGVPTGFKDLDKMTAGLQPGDLVIIAARPSMGKTALALNIAEYVALRQPTPQPVAMFSMEMGGEQLVTRLIASLGRLNQSNVRIGKLNNSEWDDLTKAWEKIVDAPIHIDETPALTPLEGRARARRLHRQHGPLGLIIVDYLQLMSSSSDRGRGDENRATQVAEISRSLKALAKELHLPLIALSQLNRGLEQRTDKRPMMSDLRESGAIEQDADVILFIYRDEMYNSESPDKGLAEIIIAKQRNGPTGKVKLTFLGPQTRFEDAAFPSSYGPSD